MLVHLYTLINMATMLIVFILIAKYIFFLPEPTNKKISCIIYSIWVVCGIIIEFFLPEDGILIHLLILGIYFSFCNKGHRIKGFFLLVPVMGLCYGFCTLLLALSELFPETEHHPINTMITLFDMLLTVLLILFFIFGKKWRAKYREEMRYRTLGNWERFILNTISILLFTSAILIVEYFDETTVFDTDVYIMFIAFFTLFLSIAIVIITLQSNKRAYYNSIADLNERYLNAEIAHFNAYQNTQQETRRIRHDMKNHLLSLEHFLNEGDINSAKDYIKSISNTIENVDTNLHTGNSLADAICNEKNHIAQQKGIIFSVDGMFPECIDINNVDLCTILANALDNAIEATANLEKSHKWIKLEIKVHGKMLFLSFSNPSVNAIDVEVGKTTKPDDLNHGFGLQNIKWALQKYNGEMSIEFKKADEINLFVLEIMLVHGN